MAQILEFPETPKFNAVRDLIADYLIRIHTARILARSIVSREEANAGLPDPDHLLAWLWLHGYKVIPLTDEDKAD